MTLDQVLNSMRCGKETDAARIAEQFHISASQATHALNRLACNHRIREVMPGKFRVVGKDFPLAQAWLGVRA